MDRFLFTSESVADGHPDKLCDQISDAIVDLFLRQDPYSRCAIETAATTNRVIVFGEYRSSATVTPQDIETTIRNVVKDIGYEQDGFHHERLIIENYLHAQSNDIAIGVDANPGAKKDEGAGDQGIMFGYATNETASFMPATLHYAHEILKALKVARMTTHKGLLLPDAKSQVTLKFETGRPIGVECLVLSTQHAKKLSQQDVRDIVIPMVTNLFPDGWMCVPEWFHVNPTGRFVIGGPDGDSGLTGRKIIVDTYGGASPHGGGAFSGKDPTKVDRSAAYIARYLAKNIVASGLADRCTLQLAYSIGISKPLSLYVNTHSTGKVPQEKIINYINNNFDLTPRGIREFLQLNKPIYQRTASYGHFGRDVDADGGFSWEKLDSVKGFSSIS